MKLDTVTDIGVRRKENQDNYWGARLLVNGEEVGVLCVCDGMGGLNDGGLASRIVVEAVKDYFKQSIDLIGLREVIEESNTKIYNKDSKMGTTCTILVCSGGKYDILHVGDSRCYLVRNDTFESLTIDHSALFKYGITRENKELWKKYRGLLTRCIGVTKDVKIDSYSGTYLDGDKFLVCSDGFWHYLDVFSVSGSELLDLNGLVQKCISKGETDNISIGVLSV